MATRKKNEDCFRSNRWIYKFIKMAELKSKIMSLSQEVKMMKAEDVEFVEV